MQITDLVGIAPVSLRDLTAEELRAAQGAISSFLENRAPCGMYLEADLVIISDGTRIWLIRLLGTFPGAPGKLVEVFIDLENEFWKGDRRVIACLGPEDEKCFVD